MPVRALGPSPALAIERFTDFDEFRPNEVIGGGTSVPLHPKDFSVSRAILALPGGLFVLQRSFARRLEAEMGTRGAGLIVPMVAPVHADTNGRLMDNFSIALMRNKVPARVLEPHANTYLMLRFNSEMQDRGWAEFDKGLELFTSELKHLNCLRTVTSDIFSFASSCKDPKEFTALSEAMQETLLAAFDSILVLDEVKRARPGSIDKHRKIVAQLDELAQSDPTAPPYSGDLAQSIGVSVRSLQTAVMAVHGMSLHQHLRLSRLWSVRGQLMKGSPLVTVKAAARANGFWHMGEFSRLYRATFGEMASETLSRGRRI